MAIRLKHISGTLLILAMAVVTAPASLAQETSRTTAQSIPDAFTDPTTTYSGDFFRNRTLSRQGTRMVGFSFPERELEWDAHATSAAFNDLMRLQNTADPTIRVPDLASPYTTTLLTMPSSRSASVGTEFIFEPF
jgi:hypothetical protein